MNAILKLSLAALAGLTLAACTTSTSRLQYPDGRIAECGPYMTSQLSSAAREAVCIDAHRQQGAVLL